MANETYPFTTFNFLVQLIIENASDLGLSTELCSMEFSECDGLEMTMEPKTVREGGNNTQQIHLVGPVSYGNLTLKRGMTRNLDLWKWFSLATGNIHRGTKADGEILMRDGARRGTVSFTLKDCLPLKIKAPALNAKDGILAIEELQIAYSSFTVKLA
jgi:phage tail-like protein